MTCVEIYTDGSYNLTTKVVGYAFIVVSDGKVVYTHSEKLINSESAVHWNVAGELLAVLKALEYCKQNSIDCVVINYDYEGIEKWITGEWKAKKDFTKKYVEEVRKYLKNLNVQFRKVKAHSTDKYNNLVDSLARKAVGG